MSKRTERMSRSAAERINRKDIVIRQNNAELEELRSQYENLDICEEDKQVIDDYIACKDARADRMAERLYEKGRKDVKRGIRIRKLIRRCVILSAIVTVVLIQYNKNEKLRESLEELLKMQNMCNLYACIGYPEKEDEYLTKNSVYFHEKLGYRKASTHIELSQVLIKRLCRFSSTQPFFLHNTA